jgi:hypothetical protein
VAPTPSKPSEYTLFFIPGRLLPDVESFFANLEQPNDYFQLVTAMRVDQLSWRPERIYRPHVRALTDQEEGVWVALPEHQAAELREMILKQSCDPD